jgi:hypothetical protein
MATNELPDKRAMSPEPLSEEDVKKGRTSSDESPDGLNGRNGDGRRGSNSTSLPPAGSSILTRGGSDGSVGSRNGSLGRGMRSVSFHVADDGEGDDDEVLGDDGGYATRH